MAKNYSQGKPFSLKNSPSKIVIKRILAFSYFYKTSHENNKHMSIFKN